MPKIGINKGTGYSILPEGQVILKITNVDYKEKFHKMVITLENKEGIKQTERFMLNTDGGLNAFSYFAHKATNNFDNDEIDTNDLVGKFLRCTIVHTVLDSTTKPGETVTFANIKEKEYATSFDDYGDEVNLNDMLGD